MEEKKFTTKIGEKDMFRFQMYHTYMGVSGWLYGLLVVLALADLIGNFNTTSMGVKILCVFLILWPIVISPINLWFRSKKQVAAAELFRNPIDLEITKEGVELTQGESGGLIEWKDVTKVVVLKKLVIFYMGKVRAHLLPLDQLSGEEASAVVELLKKYAVGVKLLPKKKMRR